MSQFIYMCICMFNIWDIYLNQMFDNDLCQVVWVGNIVYVCGQVGIDFDGNLIGFGDVCVQVEQVMKNVK